MKIVVSGGTGFVGRALCLSLARQGMNVTVLSRDSQQGNRRPGSAIDIVRWDGTTTGPWEHELDSAAAVINLAGEPIAAGRWTQERKQRIVDSRVKATELLVQAISRVSRRPPVFISASGIGYYGTSMDRVFDERDGPGSDFFADLCRSWEAAALTARACGSRVVCVRIGMVLERDGGALAKMVPPFQAFVGGPIAPGTQWVSWIHRADLIGLIEWSLTHEQVAGPVNAVAPEAVTMHDFCRMLGAALKRPSWLPVPEFALRLSFGELA
ncbi:MAG: TIGR01777 family oxidoreductase, partial [Nitrospiraceae bacterium]